MTKIIFSNRTTSLFIVGLLQVSAEGATVTLSALDRSIMVGQNDTNTAVAPAAPGDGWYSGGAAGTLRARATTQFELRTQWYFAFDVTDMLGISAADITDVTISLPQIGRLNTVSVTTDNIKLYDPNFIWDTAGSNYPVWNSGRPSGVAPVGFPGGTVLANPLGGASQFGNVTDLSNPNVEGTFTLTDGALLTTVQSWATDTANNEGFFMSYENAQNIGIAFGAPTLEITYVPEPSSALLILLGAGLTFRRRR